jgi:hypothetical protein
MAASSIRQEVRWMRRNSKAGFGAFAGVAAIASSAAAIAQAQQAGPTAQKAQQGPGGGAPLPAPATPVQDKELVETWNEHAVAELDGSHD